MLSNSTNSSLWPCLDLMELASSFFWTTNCCLYRLAGIIIFLLSVICLVFNIRYFLWYNQSLCRNTLVLSLFLASFFVLTISVPGVVFQLFTCHRYCNEIYCRTEGFISYFGGCLCMLIYMMLSINRYFLLYHYKCRLFNHYSTIICWIISLAWTFPPVFGYGISYVPEGLGFHCSINWHEHSKTGFYYIFCAFFSIYFIPLMVLLLLNARIHQIIRKTYSYYPKQDISNPKLFFSSNRRRSVYHQHFDHRSNIISFYIQKAVDRKCLRREYRFAQALISLVGAYILAWTPYAIIALSQFFHLDLLCRQTVFVTLTALIAKASVICAPLVYLNLMNIRLFKKILF